MKHLLPLLLFALCLVACEHASSVVPSNTNLELRADSVSLELLPIKDTYLTLYKGARVVVAESDVHPADSVDSIWIKVAHSQEAQGWIRQKQLTETFVPVDSISQFIYLFSHTHVSYFVVIMALFVGAYLFRVARKKQIRMVYVNDIDSIYPLLLCLLMAISATIYESVQLFAPEVWQAYYYQPTLSPFKVPFVLSVFLVSIWAIFIVALAAFDDVFSRLSPSEAFFYILALLSACIFCYFFFIFTTHFYIGYFFLVVSICIFAGKAKGMPGYKYQCGHCGEKIRLKGVCPHCGAMNK